METDKQGAAYEAVVSIEKASKLKKPVWFAGFPSQGFYPISLRVKTMLLKIKFDIATGGFHGYWYATTVYRSLYNVVLCCSRKVFQVNMNIRAF
jgi:hypothetical protein